MILNYYNNLFITPNFDLRSNYLFGSNFTNAFVIGNIGAMDDFFLVGAPATELEGYPYLTGNFLDAEGNHLFTLVRNVLTVNPRDCSKIMGNHIGYEIHDGVGNRVLKVESRYENDRLLTTVEGIFFDKSRNRAAFTDEQGRLQVSEGTKFAIDFNGVGLVHAFNMNLGEAEIASLSVRTGGTLHRVVTGKIDHQDVDMDGKIFRDVEISNCNIRVSQGDFLFMGEVNLHHNIFQFLESAGRVQELIKTIDTPQTIQRGGLVKVTGLYESRGCEHITRKQLVAGENAPNCHVCGKLVFWVLEK